MAESEAAEHGGRGGALMDLYLERRKPESDGFDFAGLREEGIRLLQEICGRVWTDYNLHDPGVTILEQLCYALTDLIYRTEFDLADYLTGEDSRIDFAGQALFPPEEIFPSRAVTVADYRKIIFDAAGDVDNVWIQPAGGGLPGLYDIWVKLREAPADFDARIDRDEVVDQVRAIYAAHRNLCEDVHSVTVVEPRYYDLRGTVQIDGGRAPAELLAEIYFRCARRVSPGMAFSSYESALGRGKSFDEVLTGPLTRHGYIDESGLDEGGWSVTISELIGIVRDIEGVRYVEDLYFQDCHGKRLDAVHADPSLRRVACLRLPAGEDEARVELYKGTRRYDVAWREVKAEVNRRLAEHEVARKKTENLSVVFQHPVGEHRDLFRYHSIQHDFPEVYGIGRFGLPESATPRRKAQARQLKAYLLFFEQVMANFLANLQGAARLFSLDRSLAQSYFHRHLDEVAVPNVEELYRSPAAMDAQVAAVVARRDRFVERRNRVLDYLLSLYGERFSQRSLSCFDYYTPDREAGVAAIRNKLRLLESLVEVGRNRAAGCNDRQPAWGNDNVAGLQRKVSILLGFPDFRTRSLTGALAEKGLAWISDVEFQHRRRLSAGWDLLDPGIADEEIQRNFAGLRPGGGGEGAREADVGGHEELEGRLFEDVVFLRDGVVSDGFLKNAVFRDRYRIGSTDGGGTFQLLFRNNEKAPWWRLARYGTWREAVLSAECLRELAVALNAGSEGVHLVEHVLLRPLSRGAHDLAVPEDFYAFRLSVVFPAWTTRCGDDGFRKLAVETVQLNCPAHVCPEFHWLDVAAMEDFEARYRHWLECRCGEGIKAESADAAALALIAFLLERRGATTEGG